MKARCAACGRPATPEDSDVVCLRPDPDSEDGTREERLHRDRRCQDAYNREADVTVRESDEHGPVVVTKEPDPKVLHPGQLVRGERGSVWLVTGSRTAGADVRCVAGPRVGAVTTRSSSSAGCRFVTQEELDAERTAKSAAKAADEDEDRCPNCWPDEGGEEAHVPHLEDPKYEEWAARGRDPNCPEHLVTEEEETMATKKKATAKKATAKKATTKEEVAKVGGRPDPWRAVDKAAKEKGFKHDGPGYRAALAAFADEHGVGHPELKRGAKRVPKPKVTGPMAADRIGEGKPEAK